MPKEPERDLTAGASKEKPSALEQALLTIKILLTAVLVGGGIWLLDSVTSN
jgi:hypothetical protein